MTKEDKHIIDRAVKEEWRIGDRSRLKRLLEKNLKLYRENVELEGRLEDLQEQLEQAKEIIRKCIEYYLDRTNEFHYEIIAEAEQFLKE